MDNKIEYETLEVCPVCGSKESTFLFTNTDRMHGIPGKFGVNQCKDCEAVYLSPKPSLKSLSLYYPDDYPPHQANEKAFISSKVMRESKDFLRNTILYEVYKLKNYTSKPRIKPSLIVRPIAYLLFPLWKRAYYGLPKINFPKYVSGGKALDIGCGTGNYIRILREFGWNVYGVEPSEKAAKIGKEKFGLDIRTGTLLDHKFPENDFHFITMNHVLEHLYNPVEVLSEAKRILRPDGMILIRTPNINAYGYKRFGKNWGPLETPRHLMLYSKQSISELAYKTELKLKTFSTIHVRSSLYWSLEYEIRDRNNNHQDFGTTGQYTTSQKLYINALDLYEKLLILSGKNAGEELQAILVKEQNQ